MKPTIAQYIEIARLGVQLIATLTEGMTPTQRLQATEALVAFGKEAMALFLAAPDAKP